MSFEFRYRNLMKRLYGSSWVHLRPHTKPRSISPPGAHLQFLLGLLFPPCTTGKPFLVNATRNATNSHVPETVARIALDNQRHQHSSTLTDSGACAHPWSPLADQPISSSPRSAAAIGHGGTLAMRIPNHFVCLVQISVYRAFAVGKISTDLAW
ncbi:uncharacterized protein LOC142817866 isoform X2 [Rhipicephalus microplus]|uniref:uncharacterized protein LOC142817866 isoform X2 n=1 Tax=Rhipicephalus microplus TaxID=6941 RepID=UPI003F6ABA83